MPKKLTTPNKKITITLSPAAQATLRALMASAMVFKVSAYLSALIFQEDKRIAEAKQGQVQDK